ncbi:MAG: benzoate-CoA ligase family protein [Acidimicrobiia bacterium]
MTAWPDVLNADQFFLRDRLDEDAGTIALRLDDGNLTFGEVDALATAYAVSLGELGVSRGDRVFIVLPDGPDFVGSLFGVFRLGAVAVMVNPGLTSSSLRAVTESARPAAAVVHERHVGHFEESVGASSVSMLVVGDTKRPSSTTHVETCPTAPDDPAVWLFSGGTTGAPKAVVQTHRSLVNTTRLYGQGSLQLTGTDITLSVPKLYFGYALGSNLLFPFSVAGSSVLFEEHPTPEAVLERIEKHRPTILVNVPSAINQMLAHPHIETCDMSSLRLVTSAGEALPESLYHRWKETVGVELLDGLGTAEMWHVFITNTEGAVRPGTLGRVVPGFEIKACDDDGLEVGPGEVGRLWVRGESLGLGYWESPEQTSESFRGEWFVGGDLVSIDVDGYVTHRGRADDAIKVKGKWFRPQEVESTLLDHANVKECAVVAVTDETGLARPVAFVVRDGEVSEQELIDWVLKNLEAYKHPRHVYFVDELPQTHLGKIDRAALKRSAD